MTVFTESIFMSFLLNNFLMICLGIVIFGILCSIVFVLEHIRTKIQYSALPGPKYHLFNFLGIMGAFPWTEKSRNGYSLNAFFPQVAEGVIQLFPKESLISLWIGFEHLVLLTKPHIIQAVLSDSSSREKPWIYKFMEGYLGRGLVTSTVETWRPRRRMMNPCFNLPALMNFLPVYNEHSAKLVSLLQKEADGRIVELMNPISLCILDIVGETILGTKLGAQENGNSDYISGLGSLTEITFNRMLTLWQWPEFVFRLTDSGKTFYRNLKVVNDFTRSIFLQKKKEYHLNEDICQNRTRSIMDQLLELHMEQKKISEEGVCDEVETFVAAGHETTVSSIIFTLYLLGLHKEILSKVQQELDRIFGNDKKRSISKEDLAEMSYLECALKESLRLYPGVPVFAREVPAISGYKLPPGSLVLVIPHVLHRDPEIYPNPEIFDPTRFFPENASKRSPYAYIPFSAGSRNCIGQLFAMLGMKVILAHVLRNFTIESLDPRDKVIPSARLTMCTESDIRFKIYPRT